MPQNNNDIVNSQEFKEFCKKNNLEVANNESVNFMLYQLLHLIKKHEYKIQKLEARLMEVGNEIVIEQLAPDTQELYRTVLADKWK